MWKECTAMITHGLSEWSVADLSGFAKTNQITDQYLNSMNIAMSYTNYDSVIHFAHKVKLRGWPGSIRFAMPSTITFLTEIKILRRALISGECAWVAIGQDSVAVGLARTRLELQLSLCWTKPSQGQSPMIDWVGFFSRADDFGSWAGLAKALQTVTAGTWHSVLHIHCSLFDDGPLFWRVLRRPPWLAKPKICSTYSCCLPFRNGIYATNISSRSTTCISQ